jgi:hypothetical protein
MVRFCAQLLSAHVSAGATGESEVGTSDDDDGHEALAEQLCCELASIARLECARMPAMKAYIASICKVRA